MPSPSQRCKAPARIRRDAGYAILEAMPPLIACVFLGVVIATGMALSGPGDVTSGASKLADTGGEQAPAPQQNTVHNDPDASGEPVGPDPSAAERRAVTVTREYTQRLAAMAGRTAVPFHGVPGSDYTGNGQPDIMVTKPSATNILDGTDPTGGFGAVEVWTQLSSSAVLTLNGPSQNDLFGLSAKSAGDLDGDGADDIIVGALLEHGTTGLEGSVDVYSGSDGTLLLTLSGQEWEYLGRTVAGVSDADGDGQWDIGVSSWVYDQDHEPYGMVSIHSGSDGALIRTFTSDLINDGFGYEVISMGDLDGDGAAETAISASLAPGSPLAWGPTKGRLHIFHGGPRAAQPEHLTALDADLTIYNTDPLIDYFGVAIELTTDQDADGMADLLVTSLVDPNTPQETTALQIYSSATGGMLWPVSTPPPGTGTGREGEILPPVDGDGNIINYSHYTSGLGVFGDTTRDLKVDQPDLNLVLERFGQPSEPGNPLSGDLSLSGVVDLGDMNIVVTAMNQASVILDFVDDTHRLLTRWSALDPYQYGDYETGGAGRVEGAGGRSITDPVHPFPRPAFPGYDSKSPCKGFINHPICGIVPDCYSMCCAPGSGCGPGLWDDQDGGGPIGGGDDDENNNGIPDNEDCSEGGSPAPTTKCPDACADDDGDGIPNQQDCDSPCFDERYSPEGCSPCADDDGDGIPNQKDCDSPCFDPRYAPGGVGRELCDPCADSDGDGTLDRDEDDDCDGIPNHLDCDSDCYEGDPDCCEPDPVTGVRPQDDPESSCSAAVRVDITVHRPKALDSGESAVSEEDELDVGVQLFENIDNDDRDDKFDTGADDLGVAGENDMCKVVVKIPSGFAKGELTVAVTQGSASVLLWKDAIKSDLFDDTIPLKVPDDVAAGGSYTLWLEALEAAGSQRTVEVKATLSTECEGRAGSTEDAFKATLLGVKDVTWEGMGNSDGHDNSLDDADPNWTSSMSGGPDVRRVFPGGRFNAGAVTPKRDKVKVHVELTTKAVEDLTVHLRSFDVDDPSADSDVVDNESLAEDNRGTSPGRAGAFVSTTTAKGSVQITTGADTASTEFQVTMQPGDNFRVVAGPDESYLDHLENDDVQIHALGGSNAEKQMIIDPQVAVPAGSATAGEVRHADLYVSPTLTVWRFLHVEVDSMGPVTDNHIEGYITALDTGDSLTATRATVSTPGILAVLDDGSPIPPDGNGRFENGKLTLAGGVHSISSLSHNGSDFVEKNTLAGGLDICADPLPFSAIHTGPSGVYLVGGTITRVQSNTTFTVSIANGNLQDLDQISGLTTLTIAGGSSGIATVVSGVSVPLNTVTVHDLKIPFVLEDDDYQRYSAGSDVPEPDISGMAGRWKTAYIFPIDDMSYNSPSAPFHLYTNDNPIFSLLNDSRGAPLSTDEFWAVMVKNVFQTEDSPASPLSDDQDPNSEGTYRAAAIRNMQGVFIAVESLEDWIVSPLPDGAGGADPDTVNAPRDSRYTEILNHEVGHLFNLEHHHGLPTVDDVHGDVMRPSSSRSASHFGVQSRNVMRSKRRPGF